MTKHHRVALRVPRVVRGCDGAPVMEAINEVLQAVEDPTPPTRDIDGALTRVRKLTLPSIHAFSQTPPDKLD
jgi:hypothetical protein